MKTGETTLVAGSFRDPSGFLFWRDGSLYRQVNGGYAQAFDYLIQSGLYGELTKSGLLVEHEEVRPALGISADAYKVLKPRLIPFISYPYEWCFSHLKNAALATLHIQQKALEKGMSLKDANAYNIQVLESRQVLIDILSFERYVEGRPWVAYKQFCEHFLAPLALMCKRDVRLGQLLRIHLEGIPLDLARSLLPIGSKLNPSIWLHIVMHSRSQRTHQSTTIRRETITKTFTRRSFFALLDSLETAIHKLTWRWDRGHWINYYEGQHNYTDDALDQKANIASEFLDRIRPQTVWDIGANTGKFSRLACTRASYVVSWDLDPACVEHNYSTMLTAGEKNILPLLLDVTNPTPGIGWDNTERMSFTDRGAIDAVLALGLIHHLALANNVPLSRIASFFQKLGDWLIVEFVPKDDSQVRRLLAMRDDVFPRYSQQDFKEEFGKFFSIESEKPIPQTSRTLYLMRKLR
ncbi:MAG: SAM-dependent methyltransferase [Candidatus Abyssobacteria bacterium SURF_5]|uniref:SAM-dependent methyltransferase n=1 Tax=Abyssobacteria bacterium (strain SURF_5) TaxID=2093360 RepID=A0A3A4P8G1_ABYX5|nr:MAG: SAM-dependent methyltransferase [Candidatus Abyssubacteria bacterium SURF_5]